MATITLTVANAIAARTLAGIAGYHTVICNDPPNAGETQANYVQRMIAAENKRKIYDYESYVANAALTASIATDIVIT